MGKAANAGVVITNLPEFRADLRRAVDASPRELTKALKTAGDFLLPLIKAKAPVGPASDGHSGQLQSGYGISATGVTAQLTNKAPYGAGAEWGRYRKWSGFMHYGPPGRFGWSTVEEHQDEIAEHIYKALSDLVTLHGWAQEG